MSDPVSAQRSVAHGMSPALVVLLLTLLLGIQPITTDLYLPGLPTLRRDLGASMAATQLTLSALIICFGAAQLVLGPLADRFGRRPVLLAGLAVYALASLGSALAPAIEALVAWRALQGVGMAAAVTCARSMVRDLFAPQDGARVMSKALSGLGVIATASPLIGGMLVQWLHWRAALLVVALFGAATLATVALRYEETVPRRDPRALQIGALWANWRAVIAHPTFRAWTLLSGFAYAGLFFLLAGGSFVYIGVLGTSKIGFGVIMLAQALAYLAGTFWCRHLLARHGLRGAVQRGALFTAAAGLSMAGLALAGVHTVWAVMLPSWLYCFGHGVHQPCGQAAAVGPFPEKAGTAASLSGFWMMAVAFAVGIFLGRSSGASLYPMTLGFALTALALCAVAWTLVQRHGEAAAAARGTQAWTA